MKRYKPMGSCYKPFSLSCQTVSRVPIIFSTNLPKQDVELSFTRETPSLHVEVGPSCSFSWEWAKKQISRKRELNYLSRNLVLGLPREKTIIACLRSRFALRNHVSRFSLDVLRCALEKP